MTDSPVVLSDLNFRCFCTYSQILLITMSFFSLFALVLMGSISFYTCHLTVRPGYTYHMYELSLLFPSSVGQGPSSASNCGYWWKRKTSPSLG